MNLIAPVTAIALFLLTLHNPSVRGMKEEPEDDHSATPHILRGPVRELLSLMGPEDLLPLCANVQTFYDRLLKRGPTFNAWGGKRTLPFAISRQFGKRNGNSQFNPWGGKRGESDDYTLSRSNIEEPGLHPGGDGKPTFNSWSGR